MNKEAANPVGIAERVGGFLSRLGQRTSLGAQQIGSAIKGTKSTGAAMNSGQRWHRAWQGVKNVAPVAGAATVGLGGLGFAAGHMMGSGNNNGVKIGSASMQAFLEELEELK